MVFSNVRCSVAIRKRGCLKETGYISLSPLALVGIGLFQKTNLEVYNNLSLANHPVDEQGHLRYRKVITSILLLIIFSCSISAKKFLASSCSEG